MEYPFDANMTDWAVPVQERTPRIGDPEPCQYVQTKSQGPCYMCAKTTDCLATYPGATGDARTVGVDPYQIRYCLSCAHQIGVWPR